MQQAKIEVVRDGSATSEELIVPLFHAWVYSVGSHWSGDDGPGFTVVRNEYDLQQDDCKLCAYRATGML